MRQISDFEICSRRWLMLDAPWYAGVSVCGPAFMIISLPSKLLLVGNCVLQRQKKQLSSPRPPDLLGPAGITAQREFAHYL
jgi:hypothetical protein